jgi:predicted phage terminase large subunit-like protein
MIDEEAFLDSLCRESFDAFAQRAFREIEPGISYEWNWHIQCISAHLQALYDGTLPDGKRRLCINVPPRSLKSYLCSIAFPAWVLGKEANQKFITTSYNFTLAKEMAQKSRILIESEWYKNLFPNTMIDDRQNEKHNFWTTQRGMYYSSAIQSVTGRGASFVVIDDPINPKEAISDTIRQDTNATIRSTIPTRFNDLRNDKWLMIMQRLHEDDPTGHFAAKDSRWYMLKLPGENKSDQPITYTLGNKTWTMNPGELLFPERLTKPVLDDLYTDLGSFNYAGQILQEPVPVGGGDFKQEWVQYYAQGACKPKEMNIVILVDPAGGDELNKKKNKLSDWTAMMVVGLATDNNRYLLDIIRDRLNPTERVNTLFMLHRKWNGMTGKSPKVGYEKYGMMSDTHYIDEKKKQDAYNFPLIILGGSMSKEERIKQLIPDLQNGRWYFPQSLIYIDGEGRRFDLVSEMVNSEMPNFPRARHDDMLDALSRIYSHELCMSFPKPKIGMVSKARMAEQQDEPDNWESF